MANKEYANTKCFIFSSDGYDEITYSELCRRGETDPSYQDKKFLVVQGMLLEVTPEQYKDYYKDKRRQKYLRECAVANGEISFDMLNTEDFSGEEMLQSDEETVTDQVMQKLLEEKLQTVMFQIPEADQLLIYRYYYANISERKLAEVYGISQQAVSKRIGKVRADLKKLLEK